MPARQPSLVRKLLCLAGLQWMLCDAVFAAQSPVITQPHSQASLLSELARVAPGDSFYMGLHLELEHHWHVYWKNPGDSGMAPNIDWHLPEGVSAQALSWPLPEKIPVPPLLNYGYHDRVLLPVKFTLSEGYTEPRLTIKGSANWLVCKEVCIPGQADLVLQLEVGERAASPHKPVLEAALAKVPKKLVLMHGDFHASDDAFSIELYAANRVFANAKKVQVFLADANLIEYAAPSNLRWKNNYLNFSQSKAATFYKLPSDISGVLVVDDVRAWEFVISH